jgi:hypothetical protein
MSEATDGRRRRKGEVNCVVGVVAHRYCDSESKFTSSIYSAVG